MKTFENKLNRDNFKKIIIRIVIYITGLSLLAFGIAVSIKSNLGVSPISSIPFVISRITGYSVGYVTFLFYFLCVIFQIIILQKDYRKKDLFQIFFSSVFGLFTDVALYILKNLSVNYYIEQIMLLGISMTLISCGIFLIIVADIVPNSPDGLCISISKKWHVKFSRIKTIFDITCVLLSILLAVIYLGNLSQIREGTIISAICIGKMVGFLLCKYSDNIKSLYTDEVSIK